MKRLVVLAALVVLGALSMAVLRAQPTSGDIQIEKVKDNLYIVTGGRQGGGIAGNTTVFIADSGVVLIDAKYAGFGKAILDQVKSVTSKPVTTIINTHSHGDHTGGNPDFPRTVEFVAHENAKTNMARMEEFKGSNAAFLPAKTFKDTHVALQRQGPDRPPLLRRRPHERRRGDRLPGPPDRRHGRSVRKEVGAVCRCHQRREHDGVSPDARKGDRRQSRTWIR